ncbi:STAS domain-containing protein [Pseudoduganella chitinolytica]|uniref:STAS domain-containing protein n=1 Tax=Pseudoduganella chitinolytica TaxID=34070 RepID=UPI003FCE0CF0
MTTGDIGAASQGALAALCIEGEMTIYRAAELKDVLFDALRQATADARALALDLSQVTEFDSAGVQLLLMARREAQRQGHPLQLVAHSPAVREVLNLTGLKARLQGDAA